MKNSIIKLTGLSLIILFGAASCKKTLFPDGINTDPNSATKASLQPSVLLTGAEYSIAYTVGGDVSRFTGVLIQSVRGVSRQFTAYDQYVFTNQDFDNVWSNFYEQGLNDLYTLRQLSDANGFNYYSGISRILMAYHFGLATDLWGDVPFTQALQGDQGILQPAYDKQQVIYDSLFVLLNSGITYLQAATAGAATPGSDDFIYGGDLGEWTKLAYSLEAKFYLHLSRVNTTTYASQILSVLPNAFTSNDDNASVPFYNANTQANPWYQYVTQRGDIGYTEGYLYSLMNSQADPRLPLFIDTTAADGGDNIGNSIGSYNSPVTLMSYAEVKFIEAEARSYNNDALATTAYNDAVTASFTSWGLTSSQAATYLTANPLTGATHAARLPIIIGQKYEALFSEPEPYNDYRRTGYPTLTPTTGSQIPTRWLYAQAELSNNSANIPTGTNLFTKVWWDQ